MALEKHHKWLIGGFSSFVLISLIAMGTFLYLFYVKIDLNYDNLNQKILDSQLETQGQISELTENLMQTNEILNSEIGSLNQELSLLQASAGEDFSGIIEEVRKSVVTIKTSAGFEGTGFLISEDGYVVTNAHVIADKSGYLATVIQTIGYQKNTENAEFIGYDGTLDIALLKISGDHKFLEFENSDSVQIGEKVIAIGNPLGLSFSVSQGIVSGVHRIGGNGIEGYIQTDAALNPGNSGGPLINKESKVIGINNFKISSGESLGFALESNYIIEAVNEISQKKLNQTLIN
ncbi:MAG TPA: trypsin-like peptidase domain-containing protein [Candidatus Nanoarchaeia archaeon]|nr:trypsin-like peptidase domain-containing protein [Candidatus Nanoarchaeia archaeon]